MTRDEWNAVLATEPATPTQVGAILGEFQRLGFTEDDRDERLAITARLLGLDSIRGNKDLTMGQAGQLYRMLLEVGDRAEVAGVVGEGQAGELELEDDEDRAAELYAAFGAAMARLPPRMSERELQAAVAELAEQLGLWVFRVPSSARTGIGRVAKTARGWPDLTIGSRRTGRMLFRECKSEYGEASAEQYEWLSMLHRNGCDQGIWRPEDWESGRIRAELETLD